MAKCTKCGKEIKNTYMLNGKAYGYNCYKQELAMVLAEKEKLANEKYQLEIAATIEILKNRSNLNDFLKSIINFYEEKGFLSNKQMKCIKLSKDEQLEKMLIMGTFDKNQIKDLLTEYTNLNDERLINMIQDQVRKNGERKYSIIRTKDIDEDYTVTRLVEYNRLEVYTKDKYLELLEII